MCLQLLGCIPFHSIPRLIWRGSAVFASEGNCEVITGILPFVATVAMSTSAIIFESWPGTSVPEAFLQVLGVQMVSQAPHTWLPQPQQPFFQTTSIKSMPTSLYIMSILMPLLQSLIISPSWGDTIFKKHLACACIVFVLLTLSGILVAVTTVICYPRYVRIFITAVDALLVLCWFSCLA